MQLLTARCVYERLDYMRTYPHVEANNTDRRFVAGDTHRPGGDVGVVGWVASNREPLIVNNPRQDRRFSSHIFLLSTPNQYPHSPTSLIQIDLNR